MLHISYAKKIILRYLFVFFFNISVVSSVSANPAVFSINSVSSLDFAVLSIPQSTPENIRISADGSGYTGTGTILSGTPHRGHFTVDIDQDGDISTFSINITNINAPSAEISLNDFHGVYDGISISSFPAGGLPSATFGSPKSLYLGANLTYSPHVVDGSTTVSYDLSVIFE